MKIKSNKVGVCPFCDNETLTYGSIQMFGDMVMFPWDCLHCNNKGQEVYSLEFVNHDIVNEKGDYVPIEDDMLESESEEDE